MEIQPYLFFDGRCEEAIAFYRDALGAQELMKMRFKDAPASEDFKTSPDVADKIMHASLQIGNSHLLMSDGQAGEQKLSHSGFSLSVTATDVASGEKHFNALAQGGKVTMPFQKTFWTEGFGMLVDKFGVPW